MKESEALARHVSEPRHSGLHYLGRRGLEGHAGPKPTGRPDRPQTRAQRNTKAAGFLEAKA